MENIQITKEIAELSNIDLDNHRCADGSPVWIDLNMGTYKNLKLKDSLELAKKAEYVNKELIRELWDKMLEINPNLKESNKYAEAIDYFLKN